MPPTANSEVYSKCIRVYQVWLLARVVGSSGEKQLVPGFGGFISATGVRPTQQSTIDYFTPINQPFTEFSVIKELLRQSGGHIGGRSGICDKHLRPWWLHEGPSP